MTFGELLSALLGWLGQFVEFLFSFVPRVRIIPWNEAGVRYVRGLEPQYVPPGLTWYWPWCTTMRLIHTSRCVMPIQPVSVETKDQVSVSIGAVLTYRVDNPVVYDAHNFDADDNLAEAAQGILRDAACDSTWEKLRGDASDGSRLASYLKNRMSKALESYGVVIESCRPNDLVRIGHVVRLFGAVNPPSGIDHV
jgi:regulator of protease activity HflC (stomatin/prohibitin superfamily)